MRTLTSALALLLLTLVLGLGQTPRAFGGAAPALNAAAGPTQIAIPAIRLVAEVVPVGYQFTGRNLVWQTADNAVGWHQSTAMPGSPGNAVMSGHNASRGSGVFRNLHKVKLDDTITVTVNGRNEDYVVTQRVILPQLYLSQKRRAESAAWLGFFGDERLTLITCYPWYTNTHWLIVVAHPVEPEKFGEAPGLTCPHESLQFPAPCW